MLNTTVAAVFDEYQRALSALDRLASAVGADHLSLVMADREAERHFSASTRNRLGMPLQLGESAMPVVAGLRPLAALGTRGTGLVASGPIISILVAAGVGAGGGLRRGLSGLGVDKEQVERIFAKVRNGALIVAAEVPAAQVHAIEEILAEGSQMQMQLKAEREPVAKPTLQQPTPQPAPTPSDPMASADELEFEREPTIVRRAS